MNRLPTPEEMPEPLAGLLRDHEHTAALVADARATFARAMRGVAGAAGSTELLRIAADLQRFLAHDLTLHIAKEEEALFPALRGLAVEFDAAIVHMEAQHDEIRARQDLIDRTMAALDAHHQEIEVERDAFIADVGRISAALSGERLAELGERVARLERILLGHFADEEEDLFVPARELLTPQVLDDLSAQVAALARRAA